MIMNVSELPMSSTLNLAEAGVTSFESKGVITHSLDLTKFPEPSGKQIMMMPFYIDDVEGSIPDELSKYKGLLKDMLSNLPDHVAWFDDCRVAYLTLSEKVLSPNESQRNPGLHIDGMFNGVLAGAWGGSGGRGRGRGGKWGSTGNGMLICSNVDNLCEFHTGTFKGIPKSYDFDGQQKLDGDCSHLRDQIGKEGITSHSQKAGEVLWADGMLVHESMPATSETKRTLVRISLPNNSPWFDSYTENPLGIKPNGDIFSDQRF